jgi:hypothetical protein
MLLRKCLILLRGMMAAFPLNYPPTTMRPLSYRAALQRLLLSAGAVKVPPSLQTDLALLRASLCSRLDTLDDYACAMYTRRLLVMCMYIYLTTVSHYCQITS